MRLQNSSHTPKARPERWDIVNEAGARFLAQNTDFADTMTLQDLAIVEVHASHHAGGLYVLDERLPNGLMVKAHDSWGDESFGRTIIVHTYDPDWNGEVDTDPNETIEWYSTGHGAIIAFMAKLTMKRYEVTLARRTFYVVTVEATDPEQAIAAATDLHSQGLIEPYCADDPESVTVTEEQP